MKRNPDIYGKAGIFREGLERRKGQEGRVTQSDE